jgi:hypothetical protein
MAEKVQSETIIPLQVKYQCYVCKQNVDKLPACSNCKQQLYCSRDCQIKDWPNHKTFCKTSKQAQLEKTLPKTKKKDNQKYKSFFYKGVGKIFSHLYQSTLRFYWQYGDSVKIALLFNTRSSFKQLVKNPDIKVPYHYTSETAMLNKFAGNTDIQDHIKKAFEQHLPLENIVVAVTDPVYKDLFMTTMGNKVLTQKVKQLVKQHNEGVKIFNDM